jgi:hypothetical protein
VAGLNATLEIPARPSECDRHLLNVGHAHPRFG